MFLKIIQQDEGQYEGTPQNSSLLGAWGPQAPANLMEP